MIEHDHKCPYCVKNGIDTKYAYNEIHGDHIIPWLHGGRTVDSNLQMLCQNAITIRVTSRVGNYYGKQTIIGKWIFTSSFCIFVTSFQIFEPYHKCKTRNNM